MKAAGGAEVVEVEVEVEVDTGLVLTAPREVVPPAPTTDVTVPGGYQDDDAIWALYHRAALALASDDEDIAIELLLRIRQHPTHAAADQATLMLERLGIRDEQPTRSGERRSGLARAELVGFQALAGAGTANMVCGLAECDGARVWTLANLAGLGAGLGLSVGLSRDGITPGQASLYNAAHRWGILNGFLLFSATGASYRQDEFGDHRYEARPLIASFLVGQALGMGSAALLDRFVGPRAGDVGMVDSMMLLSSTLVALAGPALADHIDDRGIRAWLGTMLVANAASMSLGAWLATETKPSRARTLLLDVGLGVGIGVVAGVQALIQGEDINGRAMLGFGAIGGLGGFIFTWWLTRNFDRRGEPDRMPAVQLDVSPTLGGATANFRLAL